LPCKSKISLMVAPGIRRVTGPLPALRIAGINAVIKLGDWPLRQMRK
jgi:hypothetical protein